MKPKREYIGIFVGEDVDRSGKDYLASKPLWTYDEMEDIVRGAERHGDVFIKLFDDCVAFYMRQRKVKR